MPRSRAANTSLHRSTGVLQFGAQYILESGSDKGPVAHVSVLLLGPHELACILVLGDDRSQFRRWEGTELFEANDGHITGTALDRFSLQVVVVFARDKDQALHRIFGSNLNGSERLVK